MMFVSWVFAQSNNLEAWPNRPIKIIVTFTAGGAPDILARLIAKRLSEELHVSVFIENKPGAGGNIGTEYVVRAYPDGNTLLLGTIGTQTINPFLYTSLNFNPMTELTGVAFLTATPNVLVVNKNSPFQQLSEIIQFAKSHPGELTFGSSGIGTSIHLSGELLAYQAKISIRHIPYQGRASSLPDLMAGRTTMIFDNLPSSLPLIRSGDLKALAVTSATRNETLPDIPTMVEAGLKNYEVISWFALMAPVQTPKIVMMKLNQLTNQIMQEDNIQKQLKELGMQAKPMQINDLNQFIESQAMQWSQLIQGAKIQIK